MTAQPIARSPIARLPIVRSPIGNTVSMSSRLRSRPARIVACAVAAALLVAACGGDDDQVGGPGIVDLVGALPARDREDAIWVAYADLDVATELAGEERPDRPGDEDQLLEWGMAVSGPDADVAVPWPGDTARSLALTGEVDDELGWSILDVAAFAELQTPPARFAVYRGIDHDDVTAALGSADDGVSTAGDGDDFSVNPAERTAARPLGAPLHFAARDTLLGEAPDADELRAWAEDDAGSLLDDEGLAEVVGALDELGVYAAYVMAEAADTDGPTDTMAVAQLGATEDDPARGVLIYRFPDGGERGEPLVEERLDGASFVTNRPWSERFEAWEVEVEGDLVVVTVTFADDTSPAVLYQAVVTRDLVLGPPPAG